MTVGLIGLGNAVTALAAALGRNADIVVCAGRNRPGPVGQPQSPKRYFSRKPTMRGSPRTMLSVPSVARLPDEAT